VKYKLSLFDQLQSPQIGSHDGFGLEEAPARSQPAAFEAQERGERWADIYDQESDEERTNIRCNLDNLLGAEAGDSGNRENLPVIIGRTQDWQQPHLRQQREEEQEKKASDSQSAGSSRDESRTFGTDRTGSLS